MKRFVSGPSSAILTHCEEKTTKIAGIWGFVGVDIILAMSG